MNFICCACCFSFRIFESGLLNQYFLSAGGIRLFHLYYGIPCIGIVECYLGAFAVGHYFLDGLAYQVADGDRGFGIG
jgi:hypothetical protein